MELSVIIISYNVCDYLREAIRSVMSASQGHETEILVVDNNSNDGSVSMVESEFPEVRLIASGSNEGFSAACNRGITASSGDFILILNPDTVVFPDAVSKALLFMRSHPDAGAAGARMTDGNGRFLPESKRGFPSPLTSFFKLTGIWRIFPRSALFNAYYLGHLPEESTCRADILTGAFMLIRRKTLEQAGLFDTRFFMYGEDIDLSWRIRLAGWHNYYLHDVRITHFKGKSASSNRESSVFHFYEAMYIFTEKHLEKGWRLPVKGAVKLMQTITRTRLRPIQQGKK
ncbi:MAG: glycosyltransferase family 2 protein [Bacteroidales bacterium]